MRIEVLTSMQQVFYWLVGIYALMLYAVLVISVRRGWWLSSLGAVLFGSPVLLGSLAYMLEHRSIDQILDLSALPWSLAIGDTLCVTTGAVIAALAWRERPIDGYFASWWWAAQSLIVGTIAGTAFHYVDGKNYVAQNAGAMVEAPTTVAHDFVSVPVIFGAFLCVGVPLLRRKSWHRWAILVCIVIWFALCVIDVRRGLDPWSLHVEWNPDTFTPLGQ